MPHFHFHVRTSTGLSRDEDGLEYPSLEEAYLEACRTIPGMAAELVHKGRSPMKHAFEITDRDDALLLEVPFAEVLRDDGKLARPRVPRDVANTLTAVERARALTASVHEQVEALREQMRRAQEILYARHRA